jgi:hypothetical protein
VPIFARSDTPLADGNGLGEPTVDYSLVRFNGSMHCGHPKNHNIVIPWPAKTARGNGPSDRAIAGKWFAGVELQTRTCNGDCSYESFVFPRVMEGQEPVGEVAYYKMNGQPVYNKPNLVGKYFDFCKTAFRPYDWAVTAFLVIAKHYLGGKVIIHSDGELAQWQDAMWLCQIELKFGADFELDD